MRLALLLALSSLAFAADIIPFAKQNAMVEKYRAVCHSDAARNGGLSLQHFDASKASPSLIAMMFAKLGTGAFGASGQPFDKADDAALKAAFEEESKGAETWTVERDSTSTTASGLRKSENEFYRIIATCDTATKHGSLQLAWAPEPKNGTLNVSSDLGKPVAYVIDTHEKMGNGTSSVGAGASVMLNGPLPASSLAVGDLFPGQTVVFFFDTLPADARRELSACYR